MLIDFNVEEYVSAYLECIDPEESRPTVRQMAMDIADNAMSKGHCAGENVDRVADALIPQIEYYL